ncbi:MAG: pepsin/retropepsin-like aspartic protease family protein [Planctomycetota bacterium]|nr:pepsin/retropepsin-like aspartic protease family protein [Planctomycetota bacterium]
MKFVFHRYLLITTVVASVAFAETEDGPTPLPEKSILRSAKVVLPLDSDAARPTIQATINGKGPFLFVLDTGAQGFIIYADLAKELGLPVVGKDTIGDPSDPDAIAVDRVRIESVDIDQVSLSGVTAISWDLPASMKNHIKGRGVFGLRMLSAFLVTFDYPGSKIVIENGALSARDGDNVVEWRAKGDGLPTLKLSVGDVTFDAHIDSGAPGNLTLPENTREKFSYVEEPVVVGRGRTVNSEFKVWRARLDGQMKLGSFVVVNPAIGFVSMLDSTGYANIGTAFLRDFVVTFDHKGHLVRFKKEDKP